MLNVISVMQFRKKKINFFHLINSCVNILLIQIQDYLSKGTLTSHSSIASKFWALEPDKLDLTYPQVVYVVVDLRSV